jgi:hypothetical protein
VRVVPGCPARRLGDRYCGLYHAYSEFAWLADNLGSLWAEELAGLDEVAVWNFLDALLHGYHGDVELANTRTLEECHRDVVRWGRFNFLTNWGKQFDGFKSFLLCPPGDSARVLTRRLPAHMGRGVSVSRRGFVVVAAEFARWFEAESVPQGLPCVRPAEPSAAADGGGM